jgi:hypothetical protein
VLATVLREMERPRHPVCYPAQGNFSGTTVYLIEGLVFLVTSLRHAC